MKNQPILLLIFAAVAFAGASAASQVFTLQDAVKRALAGNPDLAVDDPAREAASAELAASRSGYLPRVDLEQSYTGGNNPVYVFGTLLTQHRFTAGNFALPSLNSPDAIDNLQTRVVAQQTIWDAGRTRQRVEAARLGLETVDRSHDEHVRQLLLSVLDAYYSVSLAREALDASRTALESARAISTLAQVRVESGLAVDADVLRSQAHLAATRRLEIEAQGQLEMAKARLNRLVGLPLDAVAGDTAPLKPASFSVPAQQTLVAGQRERRPDYQRLALELKQAELEGRGRESEFLPLVSAFAAWEADNPGLTHAGGTNWTAGISLRWNIFAGGGDAARLQAARQRLEQKRRQLAALESAMALEIHQAMVQLKSAEEQVAVTRAAEAQTVESLRILKNRYDAGLATMTDLLSAESARADSRTAFAEAVYRHRLSYARLEYAAGLLNPTSEAMQN